MQFLKTADAARASAPGAIVDDGGAAAPSIMHRRNFLMNSLVTVASVASATATAAPADISPATAVTADFDMAAFRGRFELIIETLRTQYVCVGWKMDEVGAKEALESIQEDDAGPTYEFVRFMQDHGQSFEWLFSDRASSMITQLAAKSPRASRCMTAGDHSDSELLSLAKEIKACHKRLKKAEKEGDLASARAELEEAMTPALEELRPPAEFADLWDKITVAEMKLLPKDHPLVVWDRETDDQRTALWKKARDISTKRNERCGVTAAEEKFREIHGEMWVIGRKIFAAPANTPAGLMVKADAVKQLALDEEFGDVDNDHWWRSIKKDIRRMAAARDR